MGLVAFYKKELNNSQIIDSDDDFKMEQLLINEGNQSVYVFFNPLNNLCKIGLTSNIKQRWDALCAQSGMRLWKIITITLEPDIDICNKDLERILHSYFKNKRQIGEWFNLNIKDILQIRQLFWYIEGLDIDDCVKECFLGFKKQNG